ncbi:MAG TPA: hypothetical protein GXX75_25880 [Clostridiales bacterium]|nr:hypothetical protein [Clostridiales bacterium]
MRIYSRFKRTTKQYIIVSILCITVIGGAGVLTTLVITGQIKQEYRELLAEANRKLEENQREVYVAAADITAGDIITRERLVKKRVYSSQAKETFISEEQIGRLALINIPAGTQVMATMAADRSITTNLREAQYEVIHLNSNMEQDDTVDIRMLYPNGESYVVLSKKVIKGLDTDTAAIFLWMEEEEILRMSAAIVDASLYTGSKLYVTKYIEPNIQKASVITYTPSLSILSLIEKNPNIVERCSQELNKEVRKSLENRLADSMALDVSTIEWNVSPNEFPELGAGEASATAAQEADKEVKGIQDKEAGDKEVRSKEAGDADFFYYTQEEEAVGRDMEYGE